MRSSGVVCEQLDGEEEAAPTEVSSTDEDAGRLFKFLSLCLTIGLC